MAIVIENGIDIGPGIEIGGSSPAATTGSISFNGVNQYLSGTGNSGLTLDGVFTIEMWFKGGTQPNVFPTLIAQNGPWNGNATQLYICVSHAGAANVIALYNSQLNGGAPFIVGTTVVTDNVWHQVVLVRSSGVIKLYVDGVLNGSYTSSFTVNYSNFSIGSNPSDGGASTQQLAYQGSISNVRIVKGTAVYTAPFTPPTAPLTAITGTQLLLLMSTSGTAYTDSSANAITVTATGTPSWSALNPF